MSGAILVVIIGGGIALAVWSRRRAAPSGRGEPHWATSGAISGFAAGLFALLAGSMYGTCFGAKPTLLCGDFDFPPWTPWTAAAVGVGTFVLLFRAAGGGSSPTAALAAAGLGVGLVVAYVTLVVGGLALYAQGGA